MRFILRLIILAISGMLAFPGWLDAGDVLKDEIHFSITNNTAQSKQITLTRERGYIGYILFTFSHTNINATALTVDVVKGSDTNRIINRTLTGIDDLFWAADGTKLWLDLTNTVVVGVTETATNPCSVRIGLMGPEER